MAAHRLSHPWDSPGKNTGVGCHFLLQCMKVKSECEVAQSCLTLATPWPAAYQAPPSMGFSRQKYWSRVPLPSPIYPLVIEKWRLRWRDHLVQVRWDFNPGLLTSEPMVFPFCDSGAGSLPTTHSVSRTWESIRISWRAGYRTDHWAPWLESPIEKV